MHTCDVCPIPALLRPLRPRVPHGESPHIFIELGDVLHVLDGLRHVTRALSPFTLVLHRNSSAALTDISRLTSRFSSVPVEIFQLNSRVRPYRLLLNLLPTARATTHLPRAHHGAPAATTEAKQRARYVCFPRVRRGVRTDRARPKRSGRFSAPGCLVSSASVICTYASLRAPSLADDVLCVVQRDDRWERCTVYKHS